jgi:hypothetical protein
MASTGFEPLAPELASRCAVGYAGRAFTDELAIAPSMPPLWAEGGLWSTVSDLAKWLSFQLAARPGATAGSAQAESPVLAATRREMHKPRYLSDDSGQAPGASPGIRPARTTSPGFSTQAGCPASSRTRASTVARRARARRHELPAQGRVAGREADDRGGLRARRDGAARARPSGPASWSLRGSGGRASRSSSCAALTAP